MWDDIHRFCTGVIHNVLEKNVYNGNECKSDGVISTCLLVTVALPIIDI